MLFTFPIMPVGYAQRLFNILVNDAQLKIPDCSIREYHCMCALH